jgi:hypothetical protein
MEAIPTRESIYIAILGDNFRSSGSSSKTETDQATHRVEVGGAPTCTCCLSGRSLIS